MATEDRNGDLHSEKNGRFVAKGKSEAAKREEAEKVYNSDGVPKEKELFKISLKFHANKKEIRYDVVPAIPKGDFAFAKDRLNTKNHIRHAQEMFGGDMKKYQKAAVDFINRGEGNTYFSKYSGVFYKYNSKTEELAVFTTDNVIRTYHKRTNNEFYRKINSEGMVKVK